MVNVASHQMLFGFCERGASIIIDALELVADAAIAGQLPLTARNVATGNQQILNSVELVNLELHVATNIPGSPIGLRSRIEGAIQWTDLLLAARDVVRRWPCPETNM
jgi:hypothetical protein